MGSSLRGVTGAPAAGAVDSEACLSAREAVPHQATEGSRVMV